jgi:RimJ/RimL family protein N-acetyltransferase
VVGFTDLVVPDGGRWAMQAGTGVLPAHRGRRLCAALKGATAARVRDRHPDVTVVRTTVDDDNSAMLAASRRSGFHLVRRTGRWTLPLPPA